MVLSPRESIRALPDKEERLRDSVTPDKPRPELIPDHVSLGGHRKHVQKRTLAIWATSAAVGFILFSNRIITTSPQMRAAALTLVLPGAGYVACSNFTGLLLFILTYVALPVCLFAWFGAGGLFFPFALWALSGLGAYFVAGEDVLEHAGTISLVVLVVFFAYFNRLSSRARKTAAMKKAERNAFLPAALDTVDATSVAPAAEQERELSLEDLRDVQWTIDEGLRPLHDWTNFTIIDQFQTASLRYQVYEMMYCLGAYQGIYTPNFHGYTSAAFQNLIDRSLTPKVLGFWKWETLWGKFKTDYEPVDKDNIMVTGFMLQAVMLYMANTGDLRYTKPNSLKFRVTEKDIYPHDIHSLDRALVRQWKSDPFCLFSCEPNWIYSPCNLQGMTGQIVYDRVFKTNHANDILPRFEESLTTNFMEADGSILPIRSQLTGFTIPGLCGALSDVVNAFLCRGHLDHIARRMWAIFRHECVDVDEKTGQLKLKGLVGADKIDPGLYKSSEYALLPMLAYVAAEYGDEVVRKSAREACVKGVGKYTSATGATALTKELVSNSMNSSMVRSSLLRKEDWKNLISKGPSQTTLAGPILDSVPYPGVLVAKARSLTSKDLDLVLYPSAGSGEFALNLTKLVPGASYTLDGGHSTFEAARDGSATIKVHIDGRTAIKIVPFTARA